MLRRTALSWSSHVRSCTTSADVPNLDVAVVGAGFAGLYAVHRLRNLGFKVRAFEAGSGVGGTWFWNRYPGARCDIESLEYSYQFDNGLAQEWSWTERYASQPEILSYAEHVARRFDLYRDIQLNTPVVSASFEDSGSWCVTTASGAAIHARFCIMAVGCLSAANLPKIPGRSVFEGMSFHTGLWPPEGIDLSSKRVAVIGTGSSGVQVISSLAGKVRELSVFQRTPGFVVPVRNRPLEPEQLHAVKSRYHEFRSEAKTTANGHHPGPLGVGTAAAMDISAEERLAEYERRWQYGGLSFLTCFTDLMSNPQANATCSDFVRDKIRTIVKDSATAELLCPRYSIGSKRLIAAKDYFEAYNSPNVRLVDASSGIETITRDALQVAGQVYHVDCLIYATGYDAFTGSLLRVEVRGRQGQTLREKWADGPCTYLGLATAGFPNLFIVTGPGSPSVATNMLPSIEQNVDWIADCLANLRVNGLDLIEATASAEVAWSEHVRSTSDRLLRSSVASWWNGGNVPGKPRVFLPYMGGFPAYVRRCDEVAASGYSGFLRARL